MWRTFSCSIIILLLTGCTTTRYIPVESFRTDSVYITKAVHDTLRTFDSVYVEKNGDTVRIERWRTQYKSVIRTDTVQVTERDTIRVPYEVVKTEKKNEKISKIWYLIIGLAILLALVILTKKRT